MPSTNRPFFANFFAAFRAQSQFPKASSVSLAQTASASTASTNPTAANAAKDPTSSSSPRPIPGKSSSPAPSHTGNVAAQAAAQLSSARRNASTSPRPQSSSPLPRSPPTSPGAGSFQRSRTPSATGLGRRRLSDSSSDNNSSSGIKDNLASQNWYIGGRTATGEERFYQLGMVKKYSSADRMSLDRLSL